MAKVYVTKDSMTKDKDFLLFELGNVEEYEKTKHSIARDKNASLKEDFENEKKAHSETKSERNGFAKEVKALEEQITKKDEAISALEAKVADLDAQLAKVSKKVS